MSGPRLKDRMSAHPVQYRSDGRGQHSRRIDDTGADMRAQGGFALLSRQMRRCLRRTPLRAADLPTISARRPRRAGTTGGGSACDAVARGRLPEEARQLERPSAPGLAARLYAGNARVIGKTAAEKPADRTRFLQSAFSIRSYSPPTGKPPY